MGPWCSDGCIQYAGVFPFPLFVNLFSRNEESCEKWFNGLLILLGNFPLDDNENSGNKAVKDI